MVFLVTSLEVVIAHEQSNFVFMLVPDRNGLGCGRSPQRFDPGGLEHQVRDMRHTWIIIKN
jgi:hypothetical protein